MRTVGILFLLIIASALVGLDTGYSNEQSGVRFKILGIDGKKPVLRIENTKRLTLAVRTTMSFAVSFWNGDTRVRGGFSNRQGLQAFHEPLITILPAGASLEIPLRGIYFNTREDGYGENMDWREGLGTIEPGTYTVKFTSNSLGMTALGVNFTPFKVNFDIPPFEFEVKG